MTTDVLETCSMLLLQPRPAYQQNRCTTLKVKAQAIQDMTQFSCLLERYHKVPDVRLKLMKSPEVIDSTDAAARLFLQYLKGQLASSGDRARQQLDAAQLTGSKLDMKLIIACARPITDASVLLILELGQATRTLSSSLPSSVPRRSSKTHNWYRGPSLLTASFRLGLDILCREHSLI